MLIDVVAVQALAPTSLRVTFSDGLTATIDLRDRIAWTGVFASLRSSPRAFAAATVDPERAVVCWPNGADLDSDLLHAWAQGLDGPAWARGGDGADAVAPLV